LEKKPLNHFKSSWGRFAKKEKGSQKKLRKLTSKKSSGKKTKNQSINCKQTGGGLSSGRLLEYVEPKDSREGAHTNEENSSDEKSVLP